MYDRVMITLHFICSGALVFLSQIAPEGRHSGIFLGLAVAFFGMGIAWAIQEGRS